MVKQRAKLYTQTRNSCIITTIQNLLRARYGIIMSEKEQQAMKDSAKSVWIWSEENWWVFTFVYNWATWYLNKKYWIEFDIKAVSILSDEFKTLYDQGEWFWIWLLYASSWYSKSREDQEITLEEINSFNKAENKFMWHNQFYKLGYIASILQSVAYNKKIIKFSLNNLREAVKKWIYWETARYFTITDELLSYYLVELNKGTNFKQVELLDDKHRKALDMALKLRIVKRD